MAEQVQVQKQAPPAAADGDAGQVHADPRTEKLKSELDELLDDIDEVLEENAEEFVKDYIQKGGE